MDKPHIHCQWRNVARYIQSSTMHPINPTQTHQFTFLNNAPY